MELMSNTISQETTKCEGSLRFFITLVSHNLGHYITDKIALY